jgi:LemA protein
MSSFSIILILALVFVFWSIKIYNNLIALRNRYKNAFSQIDVQLKRRYDLIPNLVETAKAYMKHESTTLEAVIAARNKAVEVNRGAVTDLSAENIKNLGSAEAALSGSLGRLLAISESYPDLKANQNMMQLTEELSSTENKISFARQAFNDSVTTFNTATEVFPNNLFASFFRFQQAALLEIENPVEREAPRVSFN